MKRSALFAATMMAGVVAAAEPAFRAGPWLALQSYEESVKIEDIKSDWQTAALGLRANAEAGVGRGFDLALQLNTGLSLTDTEEWISRGQTLQLNDADLWLMEGQARLERTPAASASDAAPRQEFPKILLYPPRRDHSRCSDPAVAEKPRCCACAPASSIPTRAASILNGVDITDLPPNERKVNTIFQSYALFPT
jgi:hypothetical protein